MAHNGGMLALHSNIGLISVIPAIQAMFAAWTNYRAFHYSPIEFKPTRVATAILGVMYAVLFIAAEVDLVSIETYAALGTGLSIPVFYWVWTKPALISQRFTRELHEKERQANLLIDSILETLEDEK
jgi:hypothetical protein